MKCWIVVSVIAAFAAMGCGESDEKPFFDAGGSSVVDSGAPVTDASAFDASVLDASTPDAAVPDASGPDDAGLAEDGGASDSGAVTDGGVGDGGSVDGGSRDAGETDAATPDASNDSCGDNVLDPAEACDGAALDGVTCQNLGFGPGQLLCQPDCSDFDTSQCAPPPTCGDAAINGAEVCDGAALDGATCATLGFGPGNLACLPNCTGYDTSGCCRPQSCSAAGVQCGPLSDGCGSILDCGGCGASETCSNGRCVCVRQTCSGLGRACGTVADGCGGTLDCGGCPAGQTCSNGRCECVPETCASRGVSCGQTSDGCGNVLNCGFCESSACVNGQCVCIPRTTCSSSQQCGTEFDGCGGTLDCGACDPGLSCVNGRCRCPFVVDGDSFVIDIPTVGLTVNLTLNGAPIPAPSGGPQGRLILVDSNGAPSELPTVYSGSTTNYPATVRVVPGTYDVHWVSDQASGPWPVNRRKLLRSGVAITSTQTVNVNVAPVPATFDLTLDGAAATSSNTSSQSQGRLVLVDRADGVETPLDDAWDPMSGTVTLPQNVALLPGNYDVFYQWRGTGAGAWPVNRRRLLQQNVNFTTPRVFTSNLQTFPFTLDPFLDGQPLTSANTTLGDQGRFTVVDRNSDDTMPFPFAFDGGAVAYPATRRIIVPGQVDIIYDAINDPDGINWPINNGYRLASFVDPTAFPTFSFDVRVSQVTFDVTLNGQPLRPGDSSPTNEGRFVLSRFADRAILPETAAGAALGYPATRAVISDFNYTLIYESIASGATWPVNANRVLAGAADLTTDRTYIIDVPSVSVPVNVTLDGLSIASQTPTAQDQGGFFGQNTVARDDTFVLPSTADGGIIAYPRSIAFVPGSYRFLYSNAGTTTPGNSVWPLNEAYFVAGLLVDGTPITLDVPSTEITVDYTIDGRAAATSSLDEGRFVFRAGDDRATLSETHNGSAQYPRAVRLAPGAYEVFYQSVASGSNFPINGDTRVGCVVVQ